MAAIIPDDMVREANAVSKEPLRSARSKAAKALGEKYGFPTQTVEAHVGWYVWLRAGKKIRQTISAGAARIVLEAVAEDGPAVLLIALEALWEHIVYRKQAQVDLRALHKEFTARLPHEIDIDRASQELSLHVDAALKDTAEARAARLAVAARRPEQMIVMTRVFHRNADVIATVLLRADGICEGCGSAAPFKTPKGKLYLEVHHRLRLADGGEDSVDNAIALCPNCHRERHFGTAYVGDEGGA
jgi:5-methylcytosine-specific restriction enzyme A